MHSMLPQMRPHMSKLYFILHLLLLLKSVITEILMHSVQLQMKIYMSKFLLI